MCVNACVCVYLHVYVCICMCMYVHVCHVCMQACSQGGLVNPPRLMPDCEGDPPPFSYLAKCSYVYVLA